MIKQVLWLLFATSFNFTPKALAAAKSNAERLWKCRSAIAAPDSDAFLPVIKRDQLRRILIWKGGEKPVEIGETLLPPKAGIVMPKMSDVKTIKVLLRDNSLFIADLAPTVARAKPTVPAKLSKDVYEPILETLGIDPSPFTFPTDMPALLGQEFASLELPKTGFKKDVISPSANAGEMPVLTSGTILSVTLETNSGVNLKYDLQPVPAPSPIKKMLRTLTEADYPDTADRGWRTAASIPIFESRAFLPALTRADIESVDLNKTGSLPVPSRIGVVAPKRDAVASIEVQLRTGQLLHVVPQSPKRCGSDRAASAATANFYGDLTGKLGVSASDLNFQDGLPEMSGEEIQFVSFNGQPIEQPALSLRNVDSVTLTLKGSGATITYKVRN